MKKFIARNFYLVGNNLSVQLQQSIFIFALNATGNTLVLGAYSLCDKIVWAFRQIIIAFSSAVYPRSVVLYHEKHANWKVFKKKLTLLLGGGFVVVALCLYLLAPVVVKIFTGSMEPLAITYVKCICLVPLIAALNSVNVTDLLIKDKYHYIFIISLILLAISATVSYLLVYFNNTSLFGYYLVIVESFSLPLYFYFIHRTEKRMK
jgi:O-antigen/teichoic acid export membrane protein